MNKMKLIKSIFEELKLITINLIDDISQADIINNLFLLCKKAKLIVKLFIAKWIDTINSILLLHSVK